MGDTPEIVVENHDANVTPTEKPDASARRPSNDAIGANMDRDLLESIVNLEHELTGIDTRKTLAEGSRLCDEITMETNKLAKLIESFSAETKPSDDDIKEVVTGFTTKVNDLIKHHHDNELTDKAEVDLLKTGVEKITAAIHNAASDPAQIEEAQRILHIFIKNVDQIDGAYKSVRRRMSTTPTSAQVASPLKLNLSGHARQESSESATSSNPNTERSAGGQSVPTTPTSKTDGSMKHSNTTPDFKKKKSYSVSSKKSKSKLTDNEIEAAPVDGEENKDEKKVKRGHSRRTTLSLVLPLKKEKKPEDEEKKEKEKEKKDKKSKTPREEGDKKKKFSIKDSWKRLTSAFVPNSKEDKRHTMATAETGDAIDWDAPVSPRKEKKEREKLEKEKEKELKKQEKEEKEKEKEKEKEREKQEKEKEQESKEPKSPRRLRLSLSMRKKTKSKRDDSMMIKSSPASTAREGNTTDRTEASSTSPTPRTGRDASSEEKAPSSNGKAAVNSLKELPRTNEGPDTPKVPETPKAPETPKVPDTPKLAASPTTTATQTPATGNTPRTAHSPRAVLVREISKKMLVAKRAPSQQQLRQIKTKLSQMKLAWDEYTAGGLTTQDASEIDEHALDADIKELENMEGFDVDELVNFEPDGPALDEANMTDELNALDNILDEFDDEFDTPSMREPSSLGKVAAGPGSNSYLSAYD